MENTTTPKINLLILSRRAGTKFLIPSFMIVLSLLFWPLRSLGAACGNRPCSLFALPTACRVSCTWRAARFASRRLSSGPTLTERRTPA